jgi:alpha-galactosidase
MLCLYPECDVRHPRRVKISYIKWDHNRDLIDAGSALDGRPGVHEQTLAFYRLVEEIKAAHPGLEIETCSSGGARVDLGVLERTDRIWVSDCIDPLERQQMNRWTSQLVPPELLGSHIASGRSHTTGRVHDLSFRAATAIFGHLGIEWDLAAATAQELTDLREWISFYKANRRLLMGGDSVRVDFPDPTVVAYGIVAPDRSNAIYTVAFIGRSEVRLPGRLRLPGLDPHRRYRVRPLVVGRPPSGLKSPPWWGAITSEFETYGERRVVGWELPADGGAGLVLSGAALASTGVMAADMHPEHAILYQAEALD